MEEQNKKDLPAQSGGYFYYYLLIVVIILAGGWFLWKNGGWGSPVNEAGEQGITQNEVVQGGTNSLQGILRVSDNLARGNLMLVSGEDIKYISTVRDFNSLVGKEVEVRIENMTEGFKLLDIAAKQQ